MISREGRCILVFTRNPGPECISDVFVQARRQFFSEGRLPEVLEGSTPVLRLHLEASVQLRDGDEEEAKREAIRDER